MEEHDENSGEQPSPIPIVNRRTGSDDSSSISQFSPSYAEDDVEETLDGTLVPDENAPEVPIVNKTEPVVLPSKTGLKVKVNRLHITAEWKWTACENDTCGICRMPFEACCVDCSMPGDGCPLVLGQCRHPFHMHCILKWTETQNAPKPQCPLCRQEWKFSPEMPSGRPQ
ncbi:unnamed protein product [Auanema sp. JU1783]|nr:unnamed protein product [Auanema sp. JU1783]